MMKKIMSFLMATAIIGASAFTIGDVLPIGSDMPQPALKMKDVSGKDVSMRSSLKENGVLVMFSCNTCPYVIKNQQRTIDICNYAKKMNFGVIILNSNEAQRNDDDSYDEMKSYAKSQNYNWSHVVDKNHVVADAFGAKRTPECFLFDKSLKLVYHGAIDDNPSDADAVTQQHLKNAIQQVADGKEVAVKETRSVGCTIKRSK